MKPLATSLALLLVAALSPAMAQVAITEADMPSAGDTVRFRTTSSTLDAAETGPGHTWDFSSLSLMAEGADTMVSVGSTPVAYQFFFNNLLLYPDHKANFAMRGAAMGMQGFSVGNVFDYYKSNSAGYRNVGFGANINGLPASVQRIPVDWIYRFPLNYGDVDSSASHFQIAVPTLGFFGQDQMRRNEVDGWGTLILPADTFQVLRIKSRIARTDTVHIDQFGVGFAIPEPEAVEYKWIAPGMDEPVLQITTLAGANTLVRFYYSGEDISTEVAPAAAMAAWKVWPNPAGHVLHVEGRWRGNLELVAADGRVVRSVPGPGPATMEVGGVAPGSYVLRSTAGGRMHRVTIAR